MAKYYRAYGTCRVSGDENSYELGIYTGTIEEIKNYIEQYTRYTKGNGWKIEVYEVKPKEVGMKTLQEVYLVMQNSDSTEGRGQDRPYCLFTKKSDVDKFIRTAPGIMGVPDNGLYRCQVMVLLESLEDKERMDVEKTKKSALAKLTDYEKQVLNLKD